MTWVRFKKDFDFYPEAHNGLVTIAYKAGVVENVTRECAEAAFAAKAAEEVKRENQQSGSVQRKA